MGRPGDDVVVVVNIKGNSGDFDRATAAAIGSVKALNKQLTDMVREQRSASRGVTNLSDAMKGQGRSAYNLRRAEESLTSQLRKTREALKSEETAARGASRELDKKKLSSREARKSQEELTKAAEATTEALKSEGKQAKETAVDLEVKEKASKGAKKSQEELAAGAEATAEALKQESQEAERAAFWLHAKADAAHSAEDKQKRLERSAIGTQEALQKEAHAAMEAALGIREKGSSAKKGARDQEELAASANHASRAMRDESASALLMAEAMKRANRETGQMGSHQRGILSSNFRSQPVMAAMIASVAVAFQPIAAAVADAGVAIAQFSSGVIQPLVTDLGMIPGAVAVAGQSLLVLKASFSGVWNALRAPEGSRTQATAMKKLTKPAQDFVKTMEKDVLPKLKQTQREMQGALFGGMEKGARAMIKNFTPIRKALVGTGSALGDFFHHLGTLVGSKAFSKDLGRIMESNNKVIRTGGQGVLFLVDALRHLLLASGPVLQRVSKDFAGFAKHVDAVFKRRQEDGSLTRMLDGAWTRTKRLISIMADFGKIALGVFRAIQPVSDKSVRSFKEVADHWAKVVNSGKGQNSIRKFFQDAQPALHQFALALGATAKTLVQMGGAGQAHLAQFFKAWRTDFLPAVKTLGGVMDKDVFPPVLQVLKAFLRLVKEVAPGVGHMVRGPLKELANTLEGLMRVLGFILKGIGHLGAAGFIPLAMLIGLFEKLKKRIQATFATPVVQKVVPEFVGGGGAGGRGGGGAMFLPMGQRGLQQRTPKPMMMGAGGKPLRFTGEGFNPGAMNGLLGIPLNNSKIVGNFDRIVNGIESKARRFATRMKGIAKGIGPAFLAIQGLSALGSPNQARALKGGGRVQQFAHDVSFGLVPQPNPHWNARFNKLVQQIKRQILTNKDLRRLSSGKVAVAKVSTGLDVTGFKNDQRSFAKHLAGLALSIRHFNKKHHIQIDVDTGVTERGLRRLAMIWDSTKTIVGNDVHDLKAKIHRNLTDVAHIMGTSSASGKAAMAREFSLAVGAVRHNMKLGVISTRDGMKMIRDLMQQELRMFGFSKKEAYYESLPGRRFDGGRNEATPRGLRGVNGAIGGFARGGRSRFSSKHAVGSFVGQQGERGEDAVPLSVPPGTMVYNAQQQGAMGFAGGGSVDIVTGRGELLVGPEHRPQMEARAQARGYRDLSTMFARNAKPHYMATGGTAANGQPGPRSATTGGGGEATGGSYTRMTQEANLINSKHYPYVWGGGHNARFHGPYDCSGAVSAVLHAGGYLNSPVTSGALAHMYKPGEGRVTIYANPKHTFMRLGNRYFGTSGMFRPNGGAGWFTGTPGAGYLRGFSVRHVAGAGGPAGGGTIGHIKTPKYKGPGGLLALLGRSALSGATKAGNDRLDKVAAKFAATMGGGDFGDSKGKLGRSSLEALWDAAGGPPSKAHLMAAIALAESGGNKRAHNPSGASGLWQILGQLVPGNIFDPMINARNAVKKYRSQGLGAWAVYTSGAYKRFMAKGGIAASQGLNAARRVGAPHEVKRGHKHSSRPKRKWAPKLSKSTKHLMDMKNLKVQAKKFKGKLSLDLENNTISGLTSWDDSINDLQQQISESSGFRDLRNDELYPTINDGGDQAINTKGMWLHADYDNSFNANAPLRFIGGAQQHLYGGKFRPSGYGGEYARYDKGEVWEQQALQQVIHSYNNQVGLIDTAELGVIMSKRNVHGFLPDHGKGMSHKERLAWIRSHTGKRSGLGINKAIQERKARQKHIMERMKALAKLRKNLVKSLKHERFKKGNWRDTVDASNTNIKHWQDYLDELSKGSDHSSPGYKKAVKHAHDRIDYWKKQRSHAISTHFEGGAPRTKKALKRDILDVEDDLKALGGAKTIVAKDGGAYADVTHSLTNYQNVKKGLDEVRKTVTGQSIPDLLQQLIQLRQDMKQWMSPIKPASASAANNAQAAADLRQQQLENTVATQQSALAQFGAFQSFAPLLGQRLIGTFAQGGLISKSGMALVHKGETIVTDPDGGFRGRRVTGVGSDTPMEVTLILQGRAGELVELVDARIEKTAARVVTKQVGRGTSNLRALRGGKH
jgi:hypothetical protein